jgi:phosphatidyl-myo-inositol dimannoside synthase
MEFQSLKDNIPAYKKDEQYSQKKALLISTEFPPGPGGIGCHAFQLTKELGKLGWQFYVLSEQNYCTESEREEFNKEFPFKISTLKSGPSKFDLIKRWRYCKKIIKEYKPDFIIATNRLNVYFGILLSRRFHIPLVAIGHGTEFGIKSKAVRFYNRMAYSRADLIIAVSHFTKQEIIKAGISPRKIAVIPNGADQDVFSIIPDEKIFKFINHIELANRRIILTIGSISDRKGQWVIIEAIPNVVKEIKNLLYVVLGHYDDIAPLQKRVKELGIEKHVFFAGVRPKEELIYWYNACEVFAMTSTTTNTGDFEGFGIAVIEAALCGKPAIVSDNSGLTEAVESDVTGLVTKQKDPRSVADAILYILKNDLIRKTMGESANKRAISAYTWEKVALEYQNILTTFKH